MTTETTETAPVEPGSTPRHWRAWSADERAAYTADLAAHRALGEAEARLAAVLSPAAQQAMWEVVDLYDRIRMGATRQLVARLGRLLPGYADLIAWASDGDLNDRR